MDRRSFFGSAAALPAIRSDTERTHTFRECVILELMGHQQVAGVMTDVQIGGAPFFRVDVPDRDGKSYKATKFYAPNAIYAFRLVDQPTMMAHHSITPTRVNWDGTRYDSFDDGRLEVHSPDNGFRGY